jgi:hypothetical protein
LKPSVGQFGPGLANPMRGRPALLLEYGCGV